MFECAKRDSILFIDSIASIKSGTICTIEIIAGCHAIFDQHNCVCCSFFGIVIYMYDYGCARTFLSGLNDLLNDVFVCVFCICVWL